MEVIRNFHAGDYVFIDPFSSPASGVSAYIACAFNILCSYGVKCHVIRRDGLEDIEDFRRRVPGELEKYGDFPVVEAPESLAATKYISDKFYLHIRLHCSKSLGAAIQGEKYLESDVSDEQKEILRADWISAPSHVAVAASRYLFKLPGNVWVYPNPIPPMKYGLKGDPQFDVAFLGRWQSLKGINFLKKLINDMPDVSFRLGVDRDPKIKNKNVSWMLVDSDERKSNLLNTSRLLVLPSLFETASMVGLEAISHGVQIICWKHLGIAEYFDSSWVEKVDWFKIDDFALAIRDRLNNINCEVPPVDSLNNLFVDGFFSMSRGSGNRDLLVNYKVDISLLIKETVRHSMKNSQGKFKRKLNKFKRDPKGFFADSALAKMFVRPGAEIGVKKSLPLVSSVDFSKVNDFVNIDNDSRIRFGDVKKQLYGLNTLLLMPSGFSMAGELVSCLWSQADFSPFKESHLNIGWFDSGVEGSALDFINRIDLDNKKKLEEIDFIFVVDAPDFMVEGLRSCTTGVRLISILVDCKSDNFEVADAYILSSVNDSSGFSAARRFVKIAEIDNPMQVAIGMRRLVQESKPRDIDLLLPVFGDFDLGFDLIDFDANIFQGVVLYSGDSPVVSDPIFDSLINEFSRSVKGMMLLESVYMKYKSLCDEVERGGSPANLISACLKDGVLLDVRY